MKLIDIIGLKVVAIKGYRYNTRRKKSFEPEYILFSDKKTIVELDEQDPYTYHDCSSWAREIKVREDAELWKRIKENDHDYPPADLDIGDR